MLFSMVLWIFRNPSLVRAKLTRDKDTGKLGVELTRQVKHEGECGPETIEKVWSAPPFTHEIQEVARLLERLFKSDVFENGRRTFFEPGYLYECYNYKDGYDETFEQIPYDEFVKRKDSEEYFAKVPTDSKLLDEERVSEIIFDLISQSQVFEMTEVVFESAQIAQAEAFEIFGEKQANVKAQLDA